MELAKSLSLLDRALDPVVRPAFLPVRSCQDSLLHAGKAKRI